MAREFNKKFMHPTRKKLVDMVLTGGEYEKGAFVSFAGTDKQEIKRKVGDKWTDEDGKSWEQHAGGKVQTSELGDIMAETRAYLDALNRCKSDTCKTIKITRADKKLISKTLSTESSIVFIIILIDFGSPPISQLEGLSCSHMLLTINLP